jgi:excisionase family DNA binding protein
MAIPAEMMLTPTEAAELLGLSRPFVARLLERGEIPSERLPDSRHRLPLHVRQVGLVMVMVMPSSPVNVPAERKPFFSLPTEAAAVIDCSQRLLGRALSAITSTRPSEPLKSSGLAV